MCGIAGYLGFDDERLLREMCASITHRGPDEDGFYTEPGLGLCMRRLSVIDLTSGRQPISNENGDVWVVFNGEIYNYTELTADLKKRGHVFRTTSDTETIVHLYEDHGLDFVKHLRGMFAVALWDARRRRLVLVRDRMGEKPLYYSWHGSRLLFGSEAKAILQQRAERRVDPTAVCQFLACGYVPGPTTFFRHIRKLKPGHMLIHEGGRIETKSYWQLEQRPCTLSFSQAVDQLSEELSGIVQRCLRSDVEVGAFLSGGVDSSLLVALMVEHGVRPHSFTVGYDDAASGFNELGHAGRVAKQFCRRHHEITISGQATLDLLPRVLWQFDEPHGEPTSILVYLLCQVARNHLKVAVGGTGGDELFFGYPKHMGIRYLQYYKLLPAQVRQRFIERVVMSWPESTTGSRLAKRARRFVSGSDLPPAEAYLGWVSLLNRDVRRDLVGEAIASETGDPLGEAPLREYLLEGEGNGLYERAAALDMCNYLPEFQLTYIDRMSMAHGLEVRSPLCDYRLAEFAYSLPTQYRIRRGRSKHILKTVARRFLPRSITERRKVGFDSPIGHWMKHELRGFVERFLSREHVERSGMLRYEGVRQVIEDHLAGRRDYSLQLWSLIALEAWHRMYIEDGVRDARDYTLKDLRGGEELGTGVSFAMTATREIPLQETNGRAKRPKLHTRRHLWEAIPSSAREPIGRALSVVPLPVLLGKKFRQTLRFVRKAQWWTEDVARRYQLKQMQRICTLAYDRSPFYRRQFDSAGIHPFSLKSLDDLKKLPLIDRATLRDHLRGMCTRSWPPKRADHVSTGGTGGSPLHFYIDADRSATEYAYLVATWERAGFKLGDTLAVLRGRIVERQRDGMHHSFDPLLRHHYYSSFHTADEHMARYLRHISDLGPVFLHAYPSSVTSLARFVQREGPRPSNIRAVFAESEILRDDQRRLIEDALQCRCLSCYGQTEKAVLAGGCESNNHYHVWPTYGYFELIDSNGRPVTTVGECGEIVGTSFINTVVPFIRYRTGDHAVLVGHHCTECGRAHPLLGGIQGHRTQEMLVARDGSQIPWTALNMHDDTFRRVRQFQFYQDTPGRAVLKIVPADGFGDDDQYRILRNLSLKLDGLIEVKLSVTDAVNLPTNGKAVYVDQRISPTPPTPKGIA